MDKNAENARQAFSPQLRIVSPSLWPHAYNQWHGIDIIDSLGPSDFLQDNFLAIRRNIQSSYDSVRNSLKRLHDADIELLLYL